MLKKGFTLVELLVVIIVIGVLAALAIPQYQKMAERARASEGIQILGAIRKAQEAYFLEHAHYEGDFWGSTGALLVDFPGLPKYFNWYVSNYTITAIWGIGLCDRNATDNAGFGTYRLRILPDGTVNCRDQGVAGACAKLGYTVF